MDQSSAPHRGAAGGIHSAGAGARAALALAVEWGPCGRCVGVVRRTMGNDRGGRLSKRHEAREAWVARPAIAVRVWPPRRKSGRQRGGFRDLRRRQNDGGCGDLSLGCLRLRWVIRRPGPVGVPRERGLRRPRLLGLGRAGQGVRVRRRRDRPTGQGQRRRHRQDDKTDFSPPALHTECHKNNRSRHPDQPIRTMKAISVANYPRDHNCRPHKTLPFNGPPAIGRRVDILRPRPTVFGGATIRRFSCEWPWLPPLSRPTLRLNAF
jgi:hypothetical protein